METVYDVIILGGGPAGLAAGLYSGRGGLKTLILEKLADGGQAALTDIVENYPGSTEDETGYSLTARMAAQAKKFGCEKAYDEITKVELTGETKKLTSAGGKEYLAKTVIIATGAAPRKIGCPGEVEFTGRGVSYCATCDGALFRGKEVYVVGGGDAAVDEALFLTRFAKKVTIIHRRDALRAAFSLVEKAKANPKIDFLWNKTVQEVAGGDVLQSITLKDTQTGEASTLTASEEDGILGLFVFVGLNPNTALFEGQLELNDGYIPTDEQMRTELPGVFAAGDVRVKTLRQIVTAAADGALAATSALHYIEKNS